MEEIVIKEYCVSCGGRIPTNRKYHEKRGNYCFYCDKQASARARTDNYDYVPKKLFDFIVKKEVRFNK